MEPTTSYQIISEPIIITCNFWEQEIANKIGNMYPKTNLELETQLRGIENLKPYLLFQQTVDHQLARKMKT